MKRPESALISGNLLISLAVPPASHGGDRDSKPLGTASFQSRFSDCHRPFSQLFGRPPRSGLTACLTEVELDHGAKRFVLRSQPKGTCHAVFRAAGVAFPPAIRNVPLDTVE